MPVLTRAATVWRSHPPHPPHPRPRNDPADGQTASPDPTRVRYSVLAFLCALSMITYIDRAFWGSAQEDIRGNWG